MRTALSPDGSTLLVLTSGYNLNNGPDGNVVPSEPTEWVFVFDASRLPPVQLQAIPVPNTFGGVAWAPDGQRFYVTGGKDDVVHAFARRGAAFVPYPEVRHGRDLSRHRERLLRGLPARGGEKS